MADIWKKRNQSFFGYDGGETIKTAEAGKRTLNDWNRHIIAGQKCAYYINGVKLSDLRASMLEKGECKQLEFLDTAELKEFFKSHIFKQLLPEQAELAAHHASLQCHQAGIQHATYQYAGAYVQEQFKDMKLAEPQCTVYFDCSAEGGIITEKNAYREWVEILPDGKPKKHIRSDNKAPYATSETVYSFTPENIVLKDLVIDCPSV